ncbi:GIY-YIG nuclease family protein [Microcoleus sp. herbarium5]|uniref:GIY-YIG nuclease family protein n=1 Tax=Microcoleus sp. herbarium5 TaxID=3055434 RepID=UPI002FCE8825
MNIINFDSLFLTQKEKLPTCPAVYFVFSSKKELLYIGRANNLRNRWQNHHRFNQINHLGARIAWMEVRSESELVEIERNLIYAFKPLLNNTLVPTSIESANYSWAEDFVKELFALHREGYISNSIAHDACLELLNLARRLRSS